MLQPQGVAPVVVSSLISASSRYLSSCHGFKTPQKHFGGRGLRRCTPRVVALGDSRKKKLAVLLVLGTFFALYQVNGIMERLSSASNIALQVFASKYSKLVDTINV